MKKLSFLMLIFGIGIFTLMSCDEQECESTEEAMILSSEMVDTATVNDVVDIKVEFDVNNGCGAFAGGVLGTDPDSSNVVSVTVNALYSGCVCTEAIERIEGTLNYTPTTAGTYIFEFKKDDVVNHRDTLVVQ